MYAQGHKNNINVLISKQYQYMLVNYVFKKGGIQLLIKHQLTSDIYLWMSVGYFLRKVFQI